MRLVGVAEFRRHVRDADAARRAPLQEVDRALHAGDAGELLRADADVVLERAAQMLAAPADVPTEVFDRGRRRPQERDHGVGDPRIGQARAQTTEETYLEGAGCQSEVSEGATLH